MYEVVKRYDHSLGLSTVFRNWRDTGHCSRVHGYALAFEFVFRAPTLDERNWLIDFGDLKPLKEWLVDNHDHVMYIARDDPNCDLLLHLGELGLAKTRLVPHIGVEAFAQRAYDAAASVVQDYNRVRGTHVTVHSCTVWEHASNAARYTHVAE